VHNQIPNPALTKRDNNTLWVPDFSPDYYSKLIFSTQGITKKVRPDLNGGVSIKGLTVHNYYQEISKGRYDLSGGVTNWIQVPHSEAWYSADTCEAGFQSDQGSADNPRGDNQITVDALEALAKASRTSTGSPTTSRTSRTSTMTADLFEPNGILDHVVVVHAGVDQSDGGGAQGSYALWANSNVVDPGQGRLRVRPHGYKVANVTYQPEAAVTGVIAHEFGHDLGLPDLYDSISGTDPDTGFWDIMSSGSRSGRLNGIEPTEHGRLEQVRPRLAQPDRPGLRQPQGIRHARAGEQAAEGHPGGGAREPSRQGAHARARRTAVRTPGGRTTTRSTATSG
jgi:immune inhibitor A